MFYLVNSLLKQRNKAYTTTLAFIDESTQNVEIMIKRNLGLIFVIMAMSLNILNFGYIKKSVGSFNFWLTLVSALLLIAALVKIFIREKKENKKTKSD